MQITPSSSAGKDFDLTAKNTSVGNAAVVPPSPLVVTPKAAAPLTPGLRNVDPQINQQIANAQQALDYLDEIGTQLQRLKSDIGTRLAGRRFADAGLKQRIEQFSALWRQRADAAGGTLNGQLAYSDTAQTRQQFSIRDLDIQALRSGGIETLEFSVAGMGQQLLPVSLEPGMSQDALVQRLDKALAPADIRVTQDTRGALVFSAPEAIWPALRDNFAVRGGGIRFPSGQLNRIRLDAEPDAIRPDTWQGEDIKSLRKMLQDVIFALDRVRQARDVVKRALADANARLGALDPAHARNVVSSLVDAFARMVHQPGYQVFADIAPALISINRNRVVSLLSLD